MIILLADKLWLLHTCSSNFILMKILFSYFSWLQEELSYSDYLLGEAMLTSKFVLGVEGQLCCYSPCIRVVL